MGGGGLLDSSERGGENMRGRSGSARTGEGGCMCRRREEGRARQEFIAEFLSLQLFQRDGIIEGERKLIFQGKFNAIHRSHPLNRGGKWFKKLFYTHII